ncbi:molybdopterin-binding protein [Methylobacterium sp. Leaf456]|uniref:molybdopterin-binding protein n=1 Tax=Methylobacterium sp. Leaf456 TaxID=1736382 RepID=UPI0006F754AF|nr:molybdopterin-binding protein [Methylobacterium sp. Leaf456]KQT56916.1 molybdopterin-binding protein [Methylobacterium sp. Leaf456]
MRRAASAALMPFDAARGLLLGLARPVAARSVPLAEASGAVAAEPVLAPRDRPAAATALRDGYAVAAALLGGASPYAPVRLPGEPVWVEAGDGLPAGTDAVLPPEGLEGRDAVAEVFVGEGVREAGGDWRAGEALLAAGERIAPRHLLALAACGLSAVAVRRPHLALIVTGAPEPDALSPFLAASIARQGGTAATATVPDVPETIADAILDATADAVLVLGGTGFGRSDHSAAGLARAGRLHAHGLALRPGETAGIGEAAGRPVLLVPGGPEAALAVYLTLGRPLLAALSGSAPPESRPAVLAKKIASAIGLSEIVFLRRQGGRVVPLGGVDLPLRRLVDADAAVLVPPEREGYPEGTEIEVWDW